MKKEIMKQNIIYITLNVTLFVIVIISENLSYTILSNNIEYKLFFRVLSRGILGLLMIINSIYLAFTNKWSFLCLNTSSKQRLICGILLGIVGSIGLITSILGYGTNGDPRLIWWK